MSKRTFNSNPGLLQKFQTELCKKVKIASYAFETKYCYFRNTFIQVINYEKKSIIHFLCDWYCGQLDFALSRRAPSLTRGCLSQNICEPNLSTVQNDAHLDTALSTTALSFY